MEIRIQIDPQVNDLAMVAILANQLAELAAQVVPLKAQAIRSELGYRLKRLRTITPVDS